MKMIMDRIGDAEAEAEAEDEKRNSKRVALCAVRFGFVLVLLEAKRSE